MKCILNIKTPPDNNLKTMAQLRAGEGAEGLWCLDEVPGDDLHLVIYSHGHRDRDLTPEYRPAVLRVMGESISNSNMFDSYMMRYVGPATITITSP